MAKKAEIKFYIELDDDNIPEKIEWEATDAGFEGRKEAHSIMMSLWDPEDEMTLGIDLWGKKMLVGNMLKHSVQVLQKLADTTEKSTKKSKLAGMIREFATEYGEKVDEEISASDE